MLACGLPAYHQRPDLIVDLTQDAIDRDVRTRTSRLFETAHALEQSRIIAELDLVCVAEGFGGIDLQMKERDFRIQELNRQKSTHTEEFVSSSVEDAIVIGFAARSGGAVLSLRGAAPRN